MEAGGELPRDFGRLGGKRKRKAEDTYTAGREKGGCRIRSSKRYETTSR